MASSTLEKQVEEEQAVHDQEIEAEGAAHDEPEAKEPGKQGELIDRSQYEREDLALPKVDGEPVDRIAVKFSGTVFLDRTDPRDVDLIRPMRLGADITLMVEARTSSKAFKGATDREGELDVLVQEAGAKVHTVYRPAGQGLEEVKAA
jgi:hypothetical protein